MRKTMLMGLGLALSLSGVALAQQGGAQAPGREGHGQAGRMARRPGMPGMRALFRDITLTDAQKTQLKQLSKSNRDAMKANRDDMKKQRDAFRAAREKHDTAAVRALFQQRRDQMQKARTEQLAAVRNILTAEQQTQFDKNLADMKARMEQRGARGQRGRGGHAPGSGR